ncbi:MAG: corrinoid protein [Deltaproteobacteria bacterium]|nr:corrinoid protein [Deltaproteobacteria bacterium]
MSMEEVTTGIIEAIVKQDEEELSRVVLNGLEEGIDPMAIINEAITPGLRKVGDLFADEEVFLPELVLAGQIVTEIMHVLEEKIKGNSGNILNKGLVVMATVNGDVHDIGKNLVVLLLRAAGYEVLDLGKSVATRTIVEKVIELNPKIVGLSSLLSTTMPAQKQVIEAIVESGMRDQVKVLVGGAPVTREWAEKIGADGYAENASTAVMEADRVMGYR